MIQKLIAQALDLTQKGKSKEAIKILEYASKTEPKNVNLLYYLGFIYRSLNDFENAQSYYLKALGLAPNNADIYCALGVVHQQKKEFDFAIQNFEKAIKLNHYLVAAYNSLGFTYKLMGRLNEALDIYGRGMDILREIEQKENQPLNKTLDYSVLCNNTATILAELGNFAQAEELFEESISFKPKGADYKAPQLGLEKLRSK